MNRIHALFYATPPRTTISCQKLSGWKENKKRLTVGLLCNANGTDKWSDILMIGRKEDQTYNSNVWMTQSIFYVFLRRFNHIMKAQNCKVFLILNNFSGHIVDYTPTNVELLFLPPNTTSYLLPLDGGIIWAFKAYFKHKQYAKAYQEAWESVSAKTIENCWNATIFRFIEDKDSEDINVNQAMIQQSLAEKVLVEGLEEALDKIARSGLLSLEDYPTSKSDPLYERQCTHRVINENEIADIVMEEYDADDNAANNNSNEEIAEVESAVPFKRTYSTLEKFECVCMLLDILEDKDIDRDFVSKVEDLRNKFQKTTNSK
ncbi:hypothetical protein PHYBLDRAFT_142389 [Phycomyces blakesleeanus NRRL 1555(-)]|uniref:DDE-1 domain-containing protein n=1 Tax=Phycomyces blakesleeanus (strain ATCC 8743b / DSM 1359 / FGSC 10004 / NBRC 33097 / NRRL 1555) TaxID=763407 RepID=A0A162UPN6_PHYB8|nr:hypothetical protein PHYBLDRAFT_142389 [Phycomyces blakesleeanus NRRL 1555(-)]OAD76883.1 hypothetical protein PHYBLDRAFT_142389 [Phycomyces blakesleeanus NRRL 1555(-)]|eukprot:XP_018294923.1 hypothetical protein PHYBLDRAFT_142389 [Phycomyces blakesleeanus NRRL 1555(-)]